MKVTFTDIEWRNDDAEVFNLHAIKSITLEGMDSGIIEIECAAGKFKAPYCNLRYGGGVNHFELLTKHPYEIGTYINIAIFENVVCVAHCSRSCVPEWFDYKCRTYVAY